MKRKALVLSAIAILAVMTITGVTLAFLTDNDVATNTFTIGNVDIELLETTLHRQNHNATDEQIIENAKTYQDYLDEEGELMVPGRWVMKAPYVRNVGNNPAYVRVVARMNEAVYNAINIMLYTTATDEGAIAFDVDKDIVTEDGVVTLTFTYVEPLEADKVTYYAPFWRFQVIPELDNEDLAGLQGLNVEHVITVTAEAIQSEGFENATEAFAAFDAQMAAKN